MYWFLDGLLFMAGYAASVYTWPYLRTEIHGAQTEIIALEARIASIKTSLGLGKTPVPPVPPAKSTGL